MRHFFAIALCAVMTFSGKSFAGEAANAALDVTFKQENFDYNDPFYSAYISTESGKYTFLVPQGFRLSGNTASGIMSIGNREGTSSISFGILGSAECGELKAESFRESLLKQYSTAKIVNEFNTGVLGRNGPGFDLVWKAAGDINQRKRIIFIPSAHGVLQFTAVANAVRFNQIEGDLRTVMSTFRDGNNPKSKPVHLEHVN